MRSMGSKERTGGANMSLKEVVENANVILF